MFSPFNVPLESLTALDLDRLRKTAEGWYVEYKRELSKAPDIAKSISALANTYGGWVFYGVEELSKDDPVAGSFPGIDKKDADAALQRIRQSVAQHMNPAAHFDVRAIAGDGTSISADCVIVCVRVPQSLTAPHVHRSGRIYRRVADGSEPEAENDRFRLDQLFRRSDNLRREFADWVAKDPEFSKGEEKAPYLRLMMVADPWRDENPWLEIQASGLKKLFEVEVGLVSAVPFETLYSSTDGYVARQTSTNDPHNLGLTWRFRESLISDVFVPLSFYDVDHVDQLREHLDGYQHAERFFQLLRAKNYSSPRIVDLNMLFNLLVGVVETQRRILARANWTKPYFVKAKLLNVWRTMPFLDVDIILDRFDNDGLPLCLDEVVTTPPGSDPESFHKVDTFNDVEGEQARILLQALVIMMPIARAWGLSVDLGPEVNPPYYTRLQAAGVRAMAVQASKADAGPLR